MPTELLNDKITQLDAQIRNLKMQRYTEQLNLQCVPPAPAEDADDLSKAVHATLSSGAVQAGIRYATFNHQISVLEPIYQTLLAERTANERAAQNRAEKQEVADNSKLVEDAKARAGKDAL